LCHLAFAFLKYNGCLLLCMLYLVPCSRARQRFCRITHLVVSVPTAFSLFQLVWHFLKRFVFFTSNLFLQVICSFTSEAICFFLQVVWHFFITWTCKTCQSEISATHNCFAALICINIRLRRYEKFYITMAGKLSNLRLNQGAIFAF